MLSNTLLNKVLIICLSVSYFSTVSNTVIAQQIKPNQQTALEIPVLFLQQTVEPDLAMSKALLPPTNQGLPGIQLAIADSNTTGRFLKHHYSEQHLIDSQLEPLLAGAKSWLADNKHIIIVDMPRDSLNKLMQLPEIKNKAIVFNISVKDNDLRNTQCQPQLLHTIASHAMLTDALAQFLIYRQWNKWFLISGQNPNDKLYAQSLRRSAKRFGGKFIEQKEWSYNTDLRRTAQRELPVFTQAKDYDVILTADQANYFGDYVPYNTWLPRPVAGTQGLTPTTWHTSIEQWGALQLQNRFIKQTQRWMTSIDYSGWLALRSIAEAVTRTNSIKTSDVYNYMLSDKFQLAAFKGRKLNFRNYNGQLRQPIALVQPHSLVSQSPQEGYLHPTTDLDTLGFDRPEVSCKFNNNIN